MTTQTLANFNGKTLPLIEHANDAWFTSRDIGESLEYTRPNDAITKIYNRNKDLLDKFSATVNMGVATGNQEARIFNEEGVMIITMKSGQPKANDFIEWAVSILKAYRHNNLKALIPADKTLVDKDYYMGLLEREIKRLPRRRRPISDEERIQIVRLFDEGKSKYRIAKIMDRAGSTIRGVLKKALEARHASTH